MDSFIDNNCALYPVEDVSYLLTNNSDSVSSCLRNGDIWEDVNLELCKALIEKIPSPVVIDIGAGLGAWTVPMGKYIQDMGGIIYAYEARRLVYYQLCANLFINNLFNCYSQHLAIGKHNGTLSVSLVDELSSLNLLNYKELECDKVKVSTLDALHLPKVHLIRINNIEGGISDVLEGGKEWIAQSQNPSFVFKLQKESAHSLAQEQERLIKMVTDELNYEIKVLGNICIAQHPKNKRVNITLVEDGFSLTRLFS